MMISRVVKLIPSLTSRMWSEEKLLRVSYTTHTADTNKTTQLILNGNNETILFIPPDLVHRQRIPARPEHEAPVTGSDV
jgi:hypothetical protein